MSNRIQIINRNPIIPSEEFDNIADYLIPKDELCGRLISVDFKDKFYIINLAILLRHDKN